MILMIGHPWKGTFDVSLRFRFVAHMLLCGSCSVGSVVFLGWTAVVYLGFVAVCAVLWTVLLYTPALNILYSLA
jgi:hypothetical protein